MATTVSPQLINGIWTSWLPVTSAWGPHPKCASAAWARSGIQPDKSIFPYVYDPAYAQSVDNSLTCLPPRATTWWNGPVTKTSTITSWSLGPLVCPTDYSTVTTTIVGKTSTSVVCCPTGFKFVRNIPNNHGIDGVCTSAMPSGHVFAYASPASNSYVSVTTTLSEQIPLIAVPVEGYDFAVATTIPSASSGSSVPASATGSQTANSSGAQPTQTSQSSSGLSSGAKAGIGVGVGVGGFALIALAIAFFMMRRRRERKQAPTVNELSNDPVMRELPPGNQETKDVRPPVATSPPVEIDSNTRVAELGA